MPGDSAGPAAPTARRRLASAFPSHCPLAAVAHSFAPQTPVYSLVRLRRGKTGTGLRAHWLSRILICMLSFGYVATYVIHHVVRNFSAVLRNVLRERIAEYKRWPEKAPFS